MDGSCTSMSVKNNRSLYMPSKRSPTHQNTQPAAAFAASASRHRHPLPPPPAATATQLPPSSQPGRRRELKVAHNREVVGVDPLPKDTQLEVIRAIWFSGSALYRNPR